ncbi:preprotein translocase subunit TatB [Actinobacillus succinogenes]|uniref:SirA family protein n=1 Tax=Actinobacillus succinogenes (strain ATCC 55618 / DSM 22257 / CCUG 43843 / 130Z) TaxID=339671 RepID=A6VN72_ACTSZ|nr:sulfurtransferase TusA family protein [Actinobacillus succinogenes]ABR74419.1 SirA family protein [Actinobacillus succinogenes 130Z]PHI41159.1 preprotein translocase subunit TatB [Actinobacillus succinogenes]
MDYQLNLTKYLCPLPIVMTKRAMMELAVGDSLTLDMNHSTSMRDIRQLCEQLNYSLTLLENSDKHFKLRIQK